MPDGVSIVFGIVMPAKPGLGHASSFTFTVFSRESGSPQPRKMETIQHSCQCPCGTNQFSAVGEPIVRFFCHCTICQDKYQAPFADVTLFKLLAVRLPEQATTYGKYKRFAAIDRGICDACHEPVMAKMGAGDKGYAFISTRNFVDPSELPPSVMHVFYGTRTADIDDGLPKHSSWLSSQWAFLKLLRAEG